MSDEYTPREIRLIAERDAALTRAENAEARLANGYVPEHAALGDRAVIHSTMIITCTDPTDDGRVSVRTTVFVDGWERWQSSRAFASVDANDMGCVIEEQTNDARAWLVLTIRGET